MCNATPAERARNLATSHPLTSSANRLVSRYYDLYVHYFPILHKRALSAGLSDEDAQDIAHVALVEAYKNLNISNTQSDDSLETELIQILDDLLSKF